MKLIIVLPVFVFSTLSAMQSPPANSLILRAKISLLESLMRGNFEAREEHIYFSDFEQTTTVPYRTTLKAASEIIHQSLRPYRGLFLYNTNAIAAGNSYEFPGDSLMNDLKKGYLFRDQQEREMNLFVFQSNRLTNFMLGLDIETDHKDTKYRMKKDHPEIATPAFLESIRAQTHCVRLNRELLKIALALGDATLLNECRNTQLHLNSFTPLLEEIKALVGRPV